MLYKESHLSDQELLLAADGELPPRRQRQVQLHLKACWMCRGRMAQVESTVEQFIGSYQALLDPQMPSGDESVDLMKARLINESSEVCKRGWEVWAWQHLRGKLAIAAACALLLTLLASGYLSNRKRQSKTQGEVSNIDAEAIPNPRLTPGEAMTASRSDVCETSGQAESPQVPAALQDAVFSEYGISNAPRNAYEVDFLITPQLGGAASIRNLWPQPYYGRSWNARAKDQLEDRLHALVCKGDIDLPTAQREIASNWVDAYRKYVGSDNPM